MAKIKIVDYFSKYPCHIYKDMAGNGYILRYREKNSDGGIDNNLKLLENPYIEIDDEIIEEPIEGEHLHFCIHYHEKEMTSEEIVCRSKKRIFEQILLKLLIEQVQPKSAVHIWIEEDEKNVYIKGACLC